MMSEMWDRDDELIPEVRERLPSRSLVTRWLVRDLIPDSPPCSDKVCGGLAGSTDAAAIFLYFSKEFLVFFGTSSQLSPTWVF